MFKRIFLVGMWMGVIVVNAQQKAEVSYVDPFIGTARSDVYTRWGNEGGTYPGAVAPWGYMQLSPETKVGKGYDHADSTICYFSCYGHLSGYPAGSAGRGRIMPVMEGGVKTEDWTYSRRFRHADEYAEPGYYRVKFRDNGTMVEATASARVGVFRFSFPAGVKPVIYVGEMPGALMWSLNKYERDGDIYRFERAKQGATVISLIVCVSPAGKADAEARLQRELQGDTRLSVHDSDPIIGFVGSKYFDIFRKATAARWKGLLETIAIDDERVAPKKMFYTAMYHSMLLPWVVSDADGNYRGHDGNMHKTRGHDEYGTFSFWDTFRSLHPLLTFLFPDRQQDMLLSAMDVYAQGGRLPSGPMTGDHAIPVFVDSWVKGIRVAGPVAMNTALRQGVADTPYNHDDKDAYVRQGYVPLTYPESVTRTVEYAYDDWCLSEFGYLVQGAAGDGLTGADSRSISEKELHKLDARGRNYRNLFDPETFFLLPKEDTGFRKRPGTSGYKEGDPWVYSYFVPQHPDDLVNLMGGRAAFSERLDGALKNKDIVFDNETVFHVPYLFNYSGRPDLTQAWIHSIRDGRFTAMPGGLPGNDDLGSMSSWYIFSALGFYPVCPGRPFYDIGTPLFRSVRVRLANGKNLVIKGGLSATGGAKRTAGDGHFVRSVRFNGRVLSDLMLPHVLVSNGGVLDFELAARRSGAEVDSFRRNLGVAHFSITELGVSTAAAEPDEVVWVRFRLHNDGERGTEIVRLLADEKEVGLRHCLVEPGATVIDSVSCRLYAYGKTKLRLEGVEGGLIVEVVAAQNPGPHFAVLGLQVEPLVRKGQKISLRYTVKNVGGAVADFTGSPLLNGVAVNAGTVRLMPGEEKVLRCALPLTGIGVQTVEVEHVTAKYKVYDEGMGSLLLDLRPDSMTDGSRGVKDLSGFGNDGMIFSAGDAAAKIGFIKDGRLHFGKDVYVEVDPAPSLDEMGNTITMMAWVLPEEKGESLIDIFSKGDNHVLQIADNSSLTFFAGGWGRGDCTVPLPADWLGRWHHIAGVCTGGELRVYIDGMLAGKAEASGTVNLSVGNKWVLGRNEEFPGQRAFTGFIGDAKVFAAPLSAEQVLAIYKKGL